MASMIGYGTDVFTSFNNYFWVPVFGPILGMVYGYWFYEYLIG
jgi:glycerol uptake facilitator-like aquaporin